MHITDMIVTPVAIIDPPLLNAAGLHAPYALRIIVEIVTNDNIYGLGEVPGHFTTLELLQNAREVVIGKNPFNHNAIEQAVREQAGEQPEPEQKSPWERHLSRVLSAIEVACFDIMGKATGQSVANLLGGKIRDHVPFSAYLFYKYEGAGGELGFGTDPNATGWAAARQAAAHDPEGVVAQAQAMCDEFGFKSIKLKGGAYEPEIEVKSMFALQEAFGADVPLRLDPNGIWAIETAIKWGKEMEGVLEYYEDPVHTQEGMAKVGEAVSMPLATNMCTTAFDKIPGSIATGSEDIILSDHHIWGGLRNSIKLGKICETFGRGLSMHSNSHLGISLAAMVQLAAATPNLTYACDTHYPWQSEEVLVGGRFQFEDGSVIVSDEPGLGIELDRDELARLHQQYLDCGLTYRDDQIEMQKVQPGWEYKAVRW